MTEVHSSRYVTIRSDSTYCSGRNATTTRITIESDMLNKDEADVLYKTIIERSAESVSANLVKRD